MAEYNFECRHCKKMFTMFMRVTERMKTTIKCLGCGSAEVEPLMQAFFAKTGKKS
jgi:putative FmdB family regulatory protein